MISASKAIVTITPISVGSKTPVRVGLVDDATYGPSSGSGSGGWQIVDRPKRVAATQWVDRSPWQIQFKGIVNHDITRASAFPHGTRSDNTLTSIENECVRLETWQNATPGSLQPPVFVITGPVPGIHHKWVLYSLEFDEALRHPYEGWRYQQNVNMTFYEYVPPTGAQLDASVSSPTEDFYYKSDVLSGSSSFRLYTVNSGDTLARIAAKFHLGSTSPASVKVQQFLSMNGIRDPRSLVPGQILLLPNG